MRGIQKCFWDCELAGYNLSNDLKILCTQRLSDWLLCVCMSWAREREMRMKKSGVEKQRTYISWCVTPALSEAGETHTTNMCKGCISLGSIEGLWCKKRRSKATSLWNKLIAECCRFFLCRLTAILKPSQIFRWPIFGTLLFNLFGERNATPLQQAPRRI